MHLKLLDDSERGIDGPVLILEDDIEFLPGALSTINDAINTLPSSWELFAVGFRNDYCSGPLPDTIVHPDKTAKWCRANMFLETHAYIVRNSSAIKHLLEHENTDPGIILPLDILW